MNKDRYKVEKLRYEYEWIDVGPGPSERGGTTGMGSTLRNYRKTYYNLEDAVKELKRLQKVFPEDVVIISKFVDKEYIPGKVIVSSNGIPSWQSKIDNYYIYRWKRGNTRWPCFYLMRKGVSCVVYQKYFFKEEPTFAELMKSKVITKLFTSEKLLDAFSTTNIFHRRQKEQKMETYKIAVSWTETGIVSIRSNNVESAIKKAEKTIGNITLPEGEYLDESFRIDKETTRILNNVKGHYRV